MTDIKAAQNIHKSPQEKGKDHADAKHTIKEEGGRPELSLRMCDGEKAISSWKK